MGAYVLFSYADEVQAAAMRAASDRTIKQVYLRRIRQRLDYSRGEHQGQGDCQLRLYKPSGRRARSAEEHDVSLQIWRSPGAGRQEGRLQVAQSVQISNGQVVPHAGGDAPAPVKF